jgi:hypothetical protein
MAPLWSDGGIEMSDHIPDPTKMISDTPRMQSALLDAPEAGFAKIWQVGCDIERELTTAQDRIKRLEEAGDMLSVAAAFIGWHIEIEKWRKAKEAKP